MAVGRRRRAAPSWFAEKVRMLKRTQKKLGMTQFIALGFLIVILIGTGLLMLPLSSRAGTMMNPLDALFTATSATCVTGLVVADTFNHWNLFGQITILLMIQIGGLGFVTIGVFFAVLLRRKIGLAQRELIHESVSTLEVAGVVHLTKRIIKGTLLFEGIGAVLLALRFIPQFGFIKGIYFGIFHSISAFCNAGFDLMGSFGEYSSLTPFYGDIIINVVVMALIVIGGLGFIVWDDIYKNKLCFKRYRLHSKIVLVTTAILLLGSAVLFYFFEYHYTFAGMTEKDRLLSALFSSVTARTAGFNTVDTAALTDSSKLLTCILMFIGGSSGSTAGGIKTTTIAVIFIFVLANVQRKKGSEIFGRRLEEDSIRKACIVLVINLFLVLTAALIITTAGRFPLLDILFEVCSAMGTVGMSTGITRSLDNISKIVIILLMYCGRIGSLSFALSFMQRRKTAPVMCPEEKVNIG